MKKLIYLFLAVSLFACDAPSENDKIDWERLSDEYEKGVEEDFNREVKALISEREKQRLIALGLDPEGPIYPVVVKAEELYKEDKLEESLQLFDSILVNMDANHAHFLSWKGAILSETGRLDEAIEVYLKEVSLSKENDMPYYNIGLAKLHQEKYEIAIKYLDSAISINPDNFEGINNRAIAKKKSKDFEGAIKDYVLSHEVEPSYFHPVYNLGILYYQRGRYEEALNAFRDVVYNENLANHSHVDGSNDYIEKINNEHGVE